jgi:hypothetical protein
MRGKSWRNVSGTYAAEVEIGDDIVEIEIDFVSSGCYQPASMHGGPDGLGWPEEGEDEREFISARLDGVTLPEEQGLAYFDQFKTEIDAVEIDWD